MTTTHPLLPHTDADALQMLRDTYTAALAIMTTADFTRFGDDDTDVIPAAAATLSYMTQMLFTIDITPLDAITDILAREEMILDIACAEINTTLHDICLDLID